MSTDRARAGLVEMLRRRGLAAPARLLLDAHRPLRPLVAEAGAFLDPLLRPLLGHRASLLQGTLDDPDLYDDLIERLGDAEHR
jgi:hypothetical protein